MPLRTRYGAGTKIVLTYPDLSYLTTALADSIQQIVKTRNDGGDARVSSLYYDNNALGLDLLGCDWHPSQHDHQILAAALTRHLATLPITWQTNLSGSAHRCFLPPPGAGSRSGAEVAVRFQLGDQVAEVAAARVGSPDRPRTPDERCTSQRPPHHAAG